ncbi:unnamed protein product [Toxocara canis]|uniref:Helicase C-terminal domain-containing protein n=1 Tax=Toxocara canis TaxID=6265 RepID=A0A183VEL6_TOXCA|nr:unnamed protein product [Toxocara canis]
MKVIDYLRRPKEMRDVSEISSRKYTKHVMANTPIMPSSVRLFLMKWKSGAKLTCMMSLWCVLVQENLIPKVLLSISECIRAVDSVEQQLVFAGSEHGKVVAIRSLFQQGFEPPALIFVQSKDRARQLTSEISGFDSHIPVALISSEKSEKEVRDNTIAKFRGGSVWVLVCTELAGRGLDLKGVNLWSAISIELASRTGRAGRRGRAITYFTEKDMDMIRPIATVISQAGFPVPEYTLRVRKLTRKERKGLLRRPPKRKNVGAVKKRFIKPSPTKQTGNHAVDKNLATDLNSAKIIEKLNKRKLDYSEKDRGKRLKRKKIVESESN